MATGVVLAALSTEQAGLTLPREPVCRIRLRVFCTFRQRSPYATRLGARVGLRSCRFSRSTMKPQLTHCLYKPKLSS